MTQELDTSSLHDQETHNSEDYKYCAMLQPSFASPDQHGTRSCQHKLLLHFSKLPSFGGCDTLPTTDASPAFNNMTLQHFDIPPCFFCTQHRQYSTQFLAFMNTARSSANTDKILDFTWTTFHTYFLHLKRHYLLSFSPSFPLSDKQWQLAYTYP